MTVIDVPDTQGIIPLSLGTAKTIIDYKHLIHIIDIQAYIDNVHSIENTIELIKPIYLAKTALETTKSKLKGLRTKLDLLTPRSRSKRGLVNVLGSTIKFITGNMDYSDAERINKDIEELLANNNRLNTTYNQQMILNSNMIQRFENITNHINAEQATITKSIQDIQERNRNALNPIQIQQLNQINYNIDILTQHFNNIAEAIVLSKLNIIPKLILDPSELTQIHRSLNNTIDIISPEHIYELLELNAYYNDTNIIFNIQIPTI